jgi:hypothetical protein
VDFRGFDALAARRYLSPLRRQAGFLPEFAAHLEVHGEGLPQAIQRSRLARVFEDSPIPLDKWLTAVWLVVNCKNGVSYEIARDAEGDSEIGLVHAAPHPAGAQG